MVITASARRRDTLDRGSVVTSGKTGDPPTRAVYIKATMLPDEGQTHPYE